MRKLALLALTATLAFSADSPRDLVQRALEAQGGADRIKAIERVHFQATGYRNLLEQSERPEGPYIVEFQKLEETRDLASTRYRRALKTHIATSGDGGSTYQLTDNIAVAEADGRKLAGTAAQRDQALETLALGPERVLLTALVAPDLRLLADETLQSVPHHVLAFTWSGSPIRVFLNAATLLPTAVETKGAAARADYFAYLGGGTLRTYWSFWWLGKTGVRYPLQWDMQWNGLPARMYLIDDLKINAPDETDWSTTPELITQFEARTRQPDLEHTPLVNPKAPAAEIAPGVFFYAASWNIALVKQSDGVVVIEAPISSGYSAQAIAEANRRWPKAPIKAVITTSDAWPHLAGVREYAKRQIPIYGLDVNRPILERVIGPGAKLHVVAGRTVIGEGPNRLEIYPLRGETSERQMMVYLPEHRLLYGSDAFQKDRAGTYYNPQTVSEVINAVQREKLTPEKYFTMHMAPAAWQDLLAVPAKAAEADSPNDHKGRG